MGAGPPRAAASPTVVMRRSRSFAAVTGPRPTAPRPAAGGGTPVRRRSARRAARPASPHRSPPRPGTWFSRPRPRSAGLCPADIVRRPAALRRCEDVGPPVDPGDRPSPRRPRAAHACSRPRSVGLSRGRTTRCSGVNPGFRDTSRRTSRAGRAVGLWRGARPAPIVDEASTPNFPPGGHTSRWSPAPPAAQETPVGSLPPESPVPLMATVLRRG